MIVIHIKLTIKLSIHIDIIIVEAGFVMPKFDLTANSGAPLEVHDFSFGASSQTLAKETKLYALPACNLRTFPCW